MQAWLENLAPGYGPALMWTVVALIGLFAIPQVYTLLETATRGREATVYELKAHSLWKSAHNTMRERLQRAGEVDRRRTCPELVRLDDGSLGIRHPHTGEVEGP
jgi:hypothetical protein